MKESLKFASIVGAIAGLPLFALFGWLWNPHGSIGSDELHFIGLFGIAPLLYVAEALSPSMGLLGFLIACVVQYLWFVAWVWLLRHLWQRLSRGTSAL